MNSSPPGYWLLVFEAAVAYKKRFPLVGGEACYWMARNKVDASLGQPKLLVEDHTPPSEALELS